MDHLHLLQPYSPDAAKPSLHSRSVGRFLDAIEPAAPSRSTLVRKILKARSDRSTLFSEKLFGEPAWDMLLDLYLAELEQQRVSVGSLCVASRVPPTTALRWIAALEHEGLADRKPDPLHGRRIFVRLTPAGLAAMQSYFSRDFSILD
jgi:DNA-binding MarR family transcriptional regulator